MKYFSGKRIVALVLAMLCFVGIAGCMQTKRQTSLQQIKRQTPLQLTVAVVKGDSGDDMVRSAAELYNARNLSTEITVTGCETVSALVDLLKTETGPDLFVLPDRRLSPDEYSAYCEDIMPYLQADGGKECNVFPAIINSLGATELYELPLQFRMETWASTEEFANEKLSISVLEQYRHEGQDLLDISAWRKSDLIDWLSGYFGAAIPDDAQAEEILSDPELTKLLDAVKALPETGEEQAETGLLRRLYLNRNTSSANLNDAASGGFTLCGIPTPFGNGSLFDITAEICMNKNSTLKNEAWGFMQLLLSSEIQDTLLEDLPVNQGSFDALMAEKVKLKLLTEAETAQLKQLIGETSAAANSKTSYRSWLVLSKIWEYLDAQV